VTTVAGCTVASAATLLYMTGDYRIQQTYSRFLFHGPRGLLEVYGTREDVVTASQEFLSALDAAADSMEAAYRDVAADVPWTEWLSKDTWVDAENMKELGLTTGYVSAESDKDDEDEEKKYENTGKTAAFCPSVLNYYRSVFRGF